MSTRTTRTPTCARGRTRPQRTSWPSTAGRAPPPTGSGDHPRDG